GRERYPEHRLDGARRRWPRVEAVGELAELVAQRVAIFVEGERHELVPPLADAAAEARRLLSEQRQVASDGAVEDDLRLRDRHGGHARRGGCEHLGRGGLASSRIGRRMMPARCEADRREDERTEPGAHVRGPYRRPLGG